LSKTLSASFVQPLHIKEDLTRRLTTMCKLSPDACAPVVIATSLEAVIVTSLDELDTLLPVKNTFIHFPKCGNNETCRVRRFRTDPGPLKHMEIEQVVVHSQVSSTASGSSTPQSSIEDSAATVFSLPSDEDRKVVPCCDWHAVATPVSTPCWRGKATDPFGLWTQPPTWTPMVPSLLQFPAAFPDSAVSQPGAALTLAVPQTLWSSPTLPDTGSVFEFTMKRAEQVEWGLEVTRDESRKALLVDAVIAGGAIEAWNNQVLYGPKATPGRALRVGDFIVSLNGKCGCQAMVDESRSNTQTQKFQVLRAEV